MQFTTQSMTVVLLSALSTTSLATHVYTEFYSDHAKASHVTYDVANKNCFSFTRKPINKVGFTQLADGPYCLHAFNNPEDCDRKDENGTFLHQGVLQIFEDVKGKYHLLPDVKNANRFRWSMDACDKP